MERLRGIRALNTALSAITAAVVGGVLNLAIWFAIHTIFSATVPVGAWPLSFDAPVLASLNPWVLGLSVAAAGAILWLRWGDTDTQSRVVGRG